MGATNISFNFFQIFKNLLPKWALGRKGTPRVWIVLHYWLLYHFSKSFYSFLPPKSGPSNLLSSAQMFQKRRFFLATNLGGFPGAVLGRRVLFPHSHLRHPRGGRRFAIFVGDITAASLQKSKTGSFVNFLRPW